MRTESGKALIVCTSIHHQNTAQVARALAEVLGGEVARPDDVRYTSVSRYEVMGFGSGVYHGRLHGALFDWLSGLPDCRERVQPAFVFSTSGLSFLSKVWHAPLKRLLGRKGFEVIGEFSCRGFDTWGPLWFMGGLNRGHPDEQDLARARDFARKLMPQGPPHE
jgi:flavodoxin